MSIFTLLAARRDALTPGEIRIADAILNAPETVMRMSSASLGQDVGCSQSSVVKFCQKLGYQGYQDLKLDLSRAVAQDQPQTKDTLHGTVEVGDDLFLTARKLMASKVHAMQQTLDVNPEGALNAARDLLAGAHRVQLVGVGASSLVARDFGYKLQKLGMPILFDADSHVQMVNAATTGPKDVLLALSQSGSSLETVRIAETVQQRGGRIIAITGLAANPVNRIADIGLFTVADEERVRSSSITSRDAQLMVMDLLFLRMLQIRTDAARLIQDAAAAVAPLKV